MKNALANLLGVREDLAEDPQTPVFLKKLDNGIAAEANRDGTIYVDPNDPEGRERYQAYQDSLNLYDEYMEIL